jgi:hypothetical protein
MSFEACPERKRGRELLCAYHGYVMIEHELRARWKCWVTHLSRKQDPVKLLTLFLFFES